MPTGCFDSDDPPTTPGSGAAQSEVEADAIFGAVFRFSPDEVHIALVLLEDQVGIGAVGGDDGEETGVGEIRRHDALEAVLEPLVAAFGPNHLMEGHFGAVAGRIFAVLEEPHHFVHEALEIFEFFGRKFASRQFEGECLQREADVVDFGPVVRGELEDGEAAVGGMGDESFFGQDEERLAHGAAADIHLGGEFLFGEVFTELEASFAQGGAESAGDTVTDGDGPDEGQSTHRFRW